MATSLRVGELCGLMWSDFNEDIRILVGNRTIHAEKGGKLVTGAAKTGQSTRKILLPASTADRLLERKKTALIEWIFPNPIKPEVPTNPRSAYYQLKIILKSAELSSIRFHDLRHTFATYALSSDVDTKTLSGILGIRKPPSPLIPIPM